MLNAGIHTRMVDFYQVGALLYELLTGLPPNYSEEKKVMFDRIANQEPRIPSHLSTQVKELLEGLLQKDPVKRTGFTSGFDELKQAPFFDKLDWSALPSKEQAGPLKPHLSGKYFDKEFVVDLTQEEIKDLNLEWTGGTTEPTKTLRQKSSQAKKKPLKGNYHTAATQSLKAAALSVKNQAA